MKTKTHLKKYIQNPNKKKKKKKKVKKKKKTKKKKNLKFPGKNNLKKNLFF
jgi:hypothetical protein